VIIVKAKSVVRIGRIVFKTLTNHLIAEAYEIPRIYEPVYSRNGEEIGMVIDILGNVNAPFLAIKLNDKYKDKSNKLIGEDIFTIRFKDKSKQPQ
jgi:rRNA processing protein Gar1